MSINIRLTGVEEAIAKLNGVRTSVKKRIMKSAMTFAIRPLKPSIVSAAPSRMGVLRRSIGVRIKQYGGVIFAAVGPLTKYKETTVGTFPFEGPRNLKPRVQRPAKYIHMVERGTAPHFIPAPGNKGSGASGPGWDHPGAKAQPFLEEVGNRMRSTVTNRFASRVIQRIDAEFKKAQAKGGKFWETDL